MRQTETVPTPTVKESEKSMSAMKPVSIADMHSYSENKMESYWLTGEKYVLIDTGGGTLLCKRYFVYLLYKIFNREWIVEFKREDSARIRS